MWVQEVMGSNPSVYRFLWYVCVCCLSACRSFSLFLLIIFPICVCLLSQALCVSSSAYLRLCVVLVFVPSCFCRFPMRLPSGFPCCCSHLCILYFCLFMFDYFMSASSLQVDFYCRFPVWVAPVFVSLCTSVFCMHLDPISFLSRSLFSVICGFFLSMCLLAFRPVYSHPSQTSFAWFCRYVCWFGSLFAVSWWGKVRDGGRGNLASARARVWFSKPEPICLPIFLSAQLWVCMSLAVSRSIQFSDVVFLGGFRCLQVSLINVEVEVFPVC